MSKLTRDCPPPAMDDITLRHVASNLGKEWKTLATHLGVRRDEVDRIQADNLTSEEQIFQMLITWWQRWDNNDDGGHGGVLTALCDALEKSGRTDLAETIGSPLTDVDDFNFDVCRAEFVRYYKDAMGVVPLLPWLPSEVSKIHDIYVNLKFIEIQSKAARIVQHDLHSYDDMLRLKFHDSQPVRFILLSGIAGSGKTTIVSKIANDWTQERPDSPLSKFRLLVALSMRELKSAPDLTEAIFDQILPKDTKVSRQSLQKYMKSHSDEVLVILDGADEFDKEESQLPADGDVIDIIRNKVLRGCTVIVTTRPHMVHKLCRLNPAFVRVESTGFSDSGVKEYIEKFFKDEHPKVSADLFRCLTASESLHNLARTPMMLLLMCLIWSGEHMLPDTLTELFKEAIYFMLRRYFEKFGQPDHDDENTLSDKLLDLVQDFGKAALDGLILPGQKLVFEASELGNSKTVVTACKTGILLQERVRSKLRAVQHVTFFHKTFQEAIAGFYWAGLVESNEDSFNRYLDNVSEINATSYEYLLRFCCGTNVKAAKSLLTHVVGFQRWKNTTLAGLCLQMHLEAQSKELHGIMTPVFKNGLFFDFRSDAVVKLPFEFLMKCVCQPVVSQSFLTQLKLVTMLSVDRNIPLVLDILRQAKNVTDVILEFGPFSRLDTVMEAGLQAALSDVLSQMPLLSNLSLSGKVSLSVLFKHLARSFPADLIQRFALRGGVVTSRYLKKFTEKQNRLCEITMSNVDVNVDDSAYDVEDGDEGSADDDDQNDVAPRGIQMQSLQKLKIRYCKKRLHASSLRWSCPSLRELELVEDDLQEEDLQRVGILLSKAPLLQVLVLSGNKIGVAFPTLAEHFLSLQNLEVLMLKHTELLSDHVVHFAKDVLPQLVNLRILSISNNDSLCPQALVAVLQWTCDSSSLKELSIHSCVTEESDPQQFNSTENEESVQTTDENQGAHSSSVEILTIRCNRLGRCVPKVIRLLKKMPSLKTLDMSHMGLTGSDVVCLAEILPCCQELKELYLYSDSDFDDVGMEALLKTIPAVPHLKYLVLPASMSNEGSDLIRGCLKHRLPYDAECLFYLPHIQKVIRTVKQHTCKYLEKH